MPVDAIGMHAVLRRIRLILGLALTLILGLALTMTKAQVEVITSVQQRRRWWAEATKLRIKRPNR
jgi:hypothetical protein